MLLNKKNFCVICIGDIYYFYSKQPVVIYFCNFLRFSFVYLENLTPQKVNFHWLDTTRNKGKMCQKPIKWIFISDWHVFIIYFDNRNLIEHENRPNISDPLNANAWVEGTPYSYYKLIFFQLIYRQLHYLSALHNFFSTHLPSFTSSRSSKSVISLVLLCIF